jgi:magnesium transporter
MPVYSPNFALPQEWTYPTVGHMVRVYFRKQNKVLKVPRLSELERLEDIIWIDLQNPSFDELRDVEEHFDIRFQSKQEQAEIESSSRYFETDEEIIANTNFLQADSTQQAGFSSNGVSFILQNETLFTYREADLANFAECVRKIKASGRAFGSGKKILVSLFETGIDTDADIIEGISRNIVALGRELSFTGSTDEKLILQINRLLDDTMMLRQNIIDKQRVVTAMLRSRDFEGTELESLRILIKDVNSLLDHTTFNSERLEYLQDTFLGLINIEQNKIIKIFTVASVIFMPPTLIASIYGMNFQSFPELHWRYGYPFAILLMLLSSMTTLYLFRKKKWL